jgi:transcriptional regulator with XRE-family HTH domain
LIYLRSNLTPHMNYLSGNIRYLRKKSGQNQAELAKNFGKRQNTVGNWENGVSEPSIKELVALSQIFMVGMEELVNRDLEHKDSKEATGDRPLQLAEGLPDSGEDNLLLSVRDKEMDGFWVTLRELRRLNEKLDILMGKRGHDEKRSGL